MNLSVGIIGLPNVGKSTLFNALLKKQQALAANYPFATIEPNVGIVAVPDNRLSTLAKITAEEILKQVQDDKSKWPPIKNALIEFVDIAGLVKGASEGAGLGNKFLSHIREVRIICHVVRAFEDTDVIREGSLSPEEDYKTIQTELLLADLQTVEKQRESKAVKTDPVKKSAIEKLFTALNEGNAAREAVLTDDERESVRDLFLLSNKPEIIVLNVSEDRYNPEGIAKVTEQYKKLLFGSLTNISDDKGDNIVVICAKIESELASLSEEEQKEYLRDLGLEASGLERLIQKAYGTLGLISFLTAGEKEVRAWTIKNGINAQQAAGEIHTDFIKKFIKAEVVAFEDFVANNGWKGSREKGKARFEGKEYVMKDGDVVEFKIGS
ncbi:MAG TPA: redox-regulated ATPase YchF [Methylomirabilota bacterium]|nr:redox-regulated ATPase YchF [Methylomirabilota bacterium]